MTRIQQPVDTPPMTTSEPLLVKALKNGDEEAFTVLVETYQQMVYNTCLGFVKNEADADDLTQEVFIEVFRSIDQFREDAKLSTWLYRIAVNKSLEVIRGRKRKKRFAFISSLFDQEKGALNVPDYNHPGIIAENKERSKVIFAAMEKLPESQHTAYVLHKIEGLSYEEIGKIMEKSVSSVESIMHRAKKSLQQHLRTYYENDRK